MAQGAKLDLVEWFQKSVEEFQKVEEKWILQRVRNMYDKYGPEVEKKIFKYVAKYVMNRTNPPTTIEGLDSGYPHWAALSERYIKRKHHSRKFYYTGDLLEYMKNISDAQYWYRKPQTKIDYKNKTVTYYSMFREGRKPFMARSSEKGRKTKVLEEQKIQGKNEDDLEQRDGDNEKRPLIKPMEEFLLYKKLDRVMDRVLREFMEENHENGQSIPTATKL